MPAKKTPVQLQREIDEALAFAPGARVQLTGGDNEGALGLEGTIVDRSAPRGTSGGVWVEWDDLANPSWEPKEWLTPVKGKES